LILKEALIGTGVALLIFLAVQGYDVLPLVMILGMTALAVLLLNRKGVLAGGWGPVVDAPRTITFEDIGGQDTACQELKEALDFILQSEAMARMGIRPLKGLLLTGPPGTGKTLLAKAAASYTDAVFLACSGSEFIEMYAGVGAQRVRLLFKRARDMAVKGNKKRAIIFIDEIEVMGGKRGSHASHLEYDQTLNQLLVEMDGLHSNDDVNILIIGATNRSDMLDPALLRPGRFDRIVLVDLPDKRGRKEIMVLHTRNKPLSQEVCLDAIAQETFGFSGAQLESIANEAAIIAFRNNSEQITPEHLREAIDKVMLGEKLDRVPTVEEKRRIAIHEIGHALVGELVRPCSVSHITITPRGKALGFVRQIPPGDTLLYTKDLLEAQIRICLAGAIAEQLVLGNRSTGAAGDLMEAAKLAKHIIFAGLSPAGLVLEEEVPPESLHKMINQLVGEIENSTIKMMQQWLHLMQRAADVLMVEETLTGDDFRLMMANEMTENYLPQKRETAI